MKIIEDFVKDIKEELHGAKNYAKCATRYKTENPTMAKMYFDMANDELKHADMLHVEAVRAIEKQRAVSPPPQYMIDRWDEEHKKYVEKAAKIKLMLQMYSGR